jgi:hypothetical protein
MNEPAAPSLTVAEETGRRWEFHGRGAWALRELIRAGENGCTPIDHPGPRWSAYVFKLRRAGLDIETRHEPHGGPFPGSHVRYVLRTPLRIVERDAA